MFFVGIVIGVFIGTFFGILIAALLQAGSFYDEDKPLSRYIEDYGEGSYKVSLADMDGCKHEYNEICCNPDADEHVADFCDEVVCRTCTHFEKEDGVIEK